MFLTQNMSLNLSNLCRLCMSETKPLFPLFSTEDNIAEKITTLLPILKISKDDGLPSQICQTCLQNINIFYDFKIQCEISEETLKNYLASQQLKFQSCWNQSADTITDSDEKANEESQHEQMTAFTECKTEIDILEDVKSEPDDVSSERSATPLENNVELPSKEKNLKQSTNSLEVDKPGDSAVEVDYSTSKLIQENSLDHPPPAKRAKESDADIRESLDQDTVETETFECELCGKSFKWKYSLRQHLKRHSGARPYVCSTCGRRFASSCGLKTHLLSHSGLRSHVCDICGKQFTLKAHLKTHAIVHSGARQHTCEICGKSYTQLGSLRQHAMKHSGERPFSCEMCNKSYTQKRSLEIHIATHTGVKPYNCIICGKNFAQPSTLRAHIRSHTGLKKFVCQLCGVAYTKKKNLEKHTAKHAEQQNTGDPGSCSSDTTV